jgi:Uma2 family endonuclease
MADLLEIPNVTALSDVGLPIQSAEETADQEYDSIPLEDAAGDISYELIEGVLVAKDNWTANADQRTDNEHSAIIARISFELKLFVRAQQQRARILESGGAFYTRGNTKTVRKPDVSLTFYSDEVPLGQPSRFYMRQPPALIVEVISPGNGADEIEQKIQEFFAFGVKLIWIVYPEGKRVHIYPDSRHAYLLDHTETITGGIVLPEFSVPIRTFFED